MLKNEFDFGCALNALKGFNEYGPNPEMKMYLKLFKENVQTVVIKNGMKWRVMEDKGGNLRTEHVKSTTNIKGLTQSKVYTGKDQIHVKHKGQTITVQAFVTKYGKEINIVLGK